MPRGWDPSRVIALLYDAAAGIAPWPSAIRMLADALGAQSAMLFTPTLPAGSGLFVAHGLDAAAFADYAAYYHAKDLWFQAGETGRFRDGKIATGDELVPAPMLERSEWYNDFLKRLEAFHLLSSRIATERHPLLPRIHFSLFRPHHAPGFAEEERRKLAWLHPHIERALMIRARLEERDAAAENFRAVLQRLAGAIVLLKPDGRIDFANPAAEAILARNDGLAARKTGLRALSRPEDDKLQRAIAAALRRDSGGEDMACTVARSSGRRPYQIILSPASAAPRGGGAMIFIVDPESAPELHEARTARLLGLTGAEARLAAALACGASLADYAAAAGITEGTARWTLKQALAKTDTEKQSALVALLLKTAIVRGEPGRGS